MARDRTYAALDRPKMGAWIKFLRLLFRIINTLLAIIGVGMLIYSVDIFIKFKAAKQSNSPAAHLPQAPAPRRALQDDLRGSAQGPSPLVTSFLLMPLPDRDPRTAPRNGVFESESGVERQGTHALQKGRKGIPPAEREGSTPPAAVGRQLNRTSQSWWGRVVSLRNVGVLGRPSFAATETQGSTGEADPVLLRGTSFSSPEGPDPPEPVPPSPSPDPPEPVPPSPSPDPPEPVPPSPEPAPPEPEPPEPPPPRPRPPPPPPKKPFQHLWFVYAFGGAGLLTVVTAVTGLVGVRLNSRVLLGLYSSLLVVMLLGQALVAIALFADDAWTKRLPPDTTGEAKKLWEFIHKRLTVCKWVGLAVFGIQVASMLLAFAISSAQKAALDNQSDDEEEVWGQRRALLPRSSGGESGSGAPALPRQREEDAWSTRMREKYGLDMAQFTYSPLRGRTGSSPPPTLEPDAGGTEPRGGRCTIM